MHQNIHLFIVTYIFFILLFFNLGRLHPKLDMPNYVSERQLEFSALPKGGSNMEMNPLFPNFRSFLNNTPQALNHSLMRPYPTEVDNIYQGLVMIDIFIFQLCCLLYFLFRLKLARPDSFLYFSVFFAISMLLVIGYTIPNVGALARYRSTYLPLLLIPAICLTDWQKIGSLLRIKK